MPRKRRPTLKPAAYPGQAYGEGQDAIQAQKAIPIQDQAGQTENAIAAAARPSPVEQAAAAPRPGPGPITPLDAPTDRPHEPITHGAPFGAGAGPDASMLTAPGDPVAEQLMAMLAVYPNDDLAALVESIKAGDYTQGGPLGPRLG